MSEFQYDQGVVDGRIEAAAMHRREMANLIRELRETARSVLRRYSNGPDVHGMHVILALPDGSHP